MQYLGRYSHGCQKTIFGKIDKNGKLLNPVIKIVCTRSLTLFSIHAQQNWPTSGYLRLLIVSIKSLDKKFLT